MEVVETQLNALGLAHAPWEYFRKGISKPSEMDHIAFDGIDTKRDMRMMGEARLPLLANLCVISLSFLSFKKIQPRQSKLYMLSRKPQSEMFASLHQEMIWKE